MGLNHIYKVIWSKTKNAWVVVSEIAKRDGKSSVKSVVTSLAGKSVAAVMVAMIMCGGVASAATGTQYGTGATAAYNTSVAVGENAQATNSGVTLVGANSQIQGQYSTVVGINNKDYGTSTNNNEILGSVNNVKGQHNIIVGNGTTISSQGNDSSISSDAEGNYNVALGDFQRIGGDKNISILSDGYRLRGKQNISIGYGSHVGDSRNAEFALAIGAASAQGNNTVAIGRAALAENVHNSDTSIAIGTLSQATDSIAIGSNGTVGGIRAYLSARDSSVNIGYRNAIANNKSVILGTNNNYGFGGSTPVSTDGGVAIGHDNNISGAKNEVIIGSGNNTNGESQIAIGTNIQSNTHLGGVKGAVAIGYNSEFATLNKPSGTLNINGVNLDASNYAGNSSSLTYGNTFSIGKLNNERQLKNVAAGEISATSTDAVNGSQLYEAVRAVTAGASPDVYMHVNDGTSTQGAGNATTNLGKANEKGGATGNLAIAIGKNATAQGNAAVAIGGSSSYANAANSIAMLGTVDASAESGVAIGSGARVQGDRGSAFGPSASTYGKNATALGSSSNAFGDGSVSIGASNKADGKYSVGIGSNSVSSPENSVAIGYLTRVEGNSKDAVAIGGARIGYSIYGGTGPVGTDTDNSNSIAIGNGVQVFHKNTVAIGSYDNRTRAYMLPENTDSTKFITPVSIKRQSISYPGGVGGASTFITTYSYIDGTLGNSVYLGHESYAFTPNPLVDDDSHLTGEQSIHTKKYDSTGNIVVSNNTTGGAFGKVSKATINGDEITGFAGSQSVGAVTIGAGDYERRIQNVAAGEVSATSTDGINGSQLYAVADTLSKNMSSYMHINDGTGTQTAGNATTNYGYSGSIGGAQGQYSIAVGVNANSNISSQESIAIGHNANTQKNDSIAIGKDAKTTDLHGVALGGQTESKGEYSVSVGYGAKTGTNSSISIGQMASSDLNSYSSTVIGKDSSVSNSERSLILGSGSTIKGTSSSQSSSDSTVIGNNSHINDSMSTVALGSVVNISNLSHLSVGIGMGATIDNASQGVAIGYQSSAKNGVASVAIGAGSEVSAAKAIAIGLGAKASAESSISIGTLNEVKGAKSSAIGDPSFIDTTATGTHVQGNDNGTATNPIKASESTFMGNTNLAGTAGTTGIHVVGNNNSVDSSNVMVMGNGVTVGTGLDGAVVLGHASSADQYAAATDSTINGITFEAAGYAGNTGLNNGSIVSVGATGAERQIKNVAAGAVTATSTDAVNGSQLYKTAETILKMPINMAGDSGDTVGLKLGKTVNIKGSVTSGADVTDGNIAVVGDKATSTLSLKMAKNLTGLTSGTFTDASGNQTVINGAGVTVTPTGTGATPISITTSGINAGNQEIKGVKKGTTDDAAVNKKQMDDALAGISSTLTINDGTTDGSVNLKTGKLKVVGESGANALVTTTVSGDTISVGTSTKLQNAVTAAENSADKDLSNLSATGSDKVKTLAQDAVKVDGTGLATVSSATAAGVKTYTVNVDEGKLVIDDTTGKIGAAGASQGTTQGKDGVATTQNVASVVNSAIDKTTKALTDAKHNFAGDDATVISRKHGEQLNIKGGASTTATDLTSGNIAVVGDTTSGTLNIKMAKALTGLTSATYTDGSGNTQTVTGSSSTISDAAGNSTVVSKGGVTTTDGTNTTTVAPSGVTATDGTNTVKLTGSGIDAGNTQIKNVGKATTDDAAVNKKQMDDALKGATDNTVSLGSESGTTTAKKLSTTGGIKFNIKGETGANALISTSATGDDVTIAPTAKLTAAVTAAEKSADKDLSNISPAGETVIKNLAATSAQDAVKVTGTGLATVSDSTTGGVKTYNVDVKTGNLVVNAAGQAGAAGTTGAGGAAGADGVATTQNVASAINDAITKSKTDTAQAIADAEHKFDGDTGTTSVRKHGEVLSVKGGVTNTADLATGNIGVVSDGAGTLNIRLAKVLSGLTSASFTNAGGDSTVINGNGVTITPSATGASSISMTTAGINAGNKEIKGVANATSADAAVNKAQMDAAITAAAGGSLSTEKVVAKTLTGDTNLATVTGQTGTAKGETYEVAVSENAVKAVAQTAAQDAVKVTGTGLANVTDSTTGGVKTYNVDVKTGNLVVNAAGQAGAAGTTGAGGAAGADGVATTQNVASAINDAITKSKTDTAQAIADAEHKFDGDTGTTSVRKHGEVLSVKGGVTATTDLTTGNIGVVSDGAGTLNIRLAKVLSGLTSATYTDGAGNTQTVTGGSSTITDGAGNTTTITKGGMTTTDGTNTTTVAPAGVTATDGTNTVKLNGSGIDAGNTQIKNVGKATTDDAAVNKKQMDDAVKAATDSISTLGDNKVSLGSDSGTTTAKKLSTTGGIKFNIKGDTGANALITTSATGDDVTIAPTAKLSAAVTAAENSANKDLSNLSAAGDTYIKNLAKTAASWNVETNGAGTTAVAGGDTVNFINGDNIAITNTGRSITIGTAKNVSFDKVTVGGVVIDKNNGIDAGGKEITNVGPATSGNSAVNKTQMDTAIANAQTAATSTEKVVAKTLTGDNNLVTVTGQTGTAKGETYEVAVSENAVKAVAQTAAQDAVKVTGTGLANVTDSTTGGVKTYNVDVKTGNLVVNAAGQAGAAGTTGAGGAAGADGVATTQNVASAINDAITKSKTDTAQAIADAEHKFDGDTGTTSVRKHGEVLSIKGGVTATTDLTTGNIGVVSDGAGTLNIRLAKTLTGLTSAAFTDGTHTVTIAGSGIDAGNTEIKHVGKATTDDAAVNKKQMDDAVKAATDSVTTLGDNKVSLGSDSGTTTAKKLSTTGGIKFNIKGDTGANALITTSATGDDVTIAPTAKLSAAVTAAENSANKDLSNLSTAGNTYIQNLAKSAASWNVETNGAGTTAVAGGDTVNFINGDNMAITNTGRAITIGTAKNVSFDKVTVGGVVIDKNNGIDAGGKEITNVGPATSGNSAVNKTQMDTAITNAVNKATTDAKHDFGGDDTTVVTRKHGEKLNIKGGASTTAADLTSGNIAVLGDSTTGTLNIRMAKALTGLSSATFTTPSGTTVINGGGMTITPSTTGAAPISITTGGINAGNTEIKNVAAGTTPNSAVNKQQMDSAISNATANVGFNTAGNTGTGSVSNGQTLSITGTNGIETNASGQSITVGLDAATRAQINNATTTANNAAKKDLSNIDNAGKQVIKDTAAWNVKVNGAAAEIVKGGDTVTFNDGDNIKVTNTGKDITIATKKDVSFDKVTVGNVVIDKNTNRISGLANAANNDEAVNLGQMNAAISTATAGTGNIKYKANGGTQNSVALTTGFDFKGDSNIQITADPANSGVINYKLNPALTGITSISGGTGAPTITLNAGSGSTPGNVSINSNLDMGGKQINNIGAATHAGDAVNKAQMDQALQNIAGASSNAAKSYAYKAGAGAAALAALKPIQYDPLEPTQIMAGIGNYKSQTAVALGVAHYTNENTMFNLGVSLDSHDGIVNAGVTHKFGYSPEKKAIPDKYKGGPISSIYVMQDEVTALQAIVQKQAAENEALRQQNEDMQRKVDMILSKIH